MPVGERDMRTGSQVVVSYVLKRELFVIQGFWAGVQEVTGW